MRKLMLGKVRDTKKMVRVAGKSGDPNECYSTFSYLLRDERDGECFNFYGHHWAGLGQDQLVHVPKPLEFIEREDFVLSDEDAAKIETMLV